MEKIKKEKKQKHRQLGYRDSKWGYLFIMPMLLGFIIITVLPIIATFI